MISRNEVCGLLSILWIVVSIGEWGCKVGWLGSLGRVMMFCDWLGFDFIF